MFGLHLFVAPVIEPGATGRAVWFPPGAWLDWWTGDVVTGPVQRMVAADLATLPLFIRRGGIVPMLRDTIDTLSPVADTQAIDSYATTPGVLGVRVAPGWEESVFEVFDGTVLVQRANATQLVYTPGTRFTHGALFEVIAVAAAPTAVLDGATPLPEHASAAALAAASSGWFYDAAATGGTLWIKIAGAATLTVQ
jgi:alpha-D-xyloside xylohydrolase